MRRINRSIVVGVVKGDRASFSLASGRLVRAGQVEGMLQPQSARLGILDELAKPCRASEIKVELNAASDSCVRQKT